MAENIANATPAATNAKARIDLIKKLDSELRPLESKKESINEQIREKRQSFKADTGITLADFDAARRVAMMDDDDERQGKLDNFIECYNALKPGEQLSWLDAVDRKKEATQTAEAREAILSDAKKMEKAGHASGKAGSGVDTCPVDKDHKNHAAWMKGWKKGQGELAKGMAPAQ